MFGEGLSKSEIEEKLDGKGEFIQIDYLTNILRNQMPLDVRKFVYLKLIEIYERRKMFNDVGKNYEGLALISIAFSEKIKCYVKATESYIKSGFFDKADYAMKKAINDSNSLERQEILFVIKDFYKRQAKEYESELKRNHAAKLYEKLLQMNITDLERKEFKEKLMKLYEKLGRLKEYYALKRFEEREF